MDFCDPCDLLDFCDVDGLIIDDFLVENLCMDKSSTKLYTVTPITNFKILLLKRNLKFYMEEDYSATHISECTTLKCSEISKVNCCTSIWYPRYLIKLSGLN